MAKKKVTEAAAVLPIGEEQIRKAKSTLERYMQDSGAFRERIIENEEYYEYSTTAGRTRSKSRCDKFVKSQSAYLFNSIANKHADFMDNIPMPAILPREESDKETAKLLSDIVPCVLEQNNFEQAYSEACYEKLIAGAAVYGVFWNGGLHNGIGDIEVKKAELLNLYWQSGTENIQDSPNLFYLSIWDNKLLKIRYPQLIDKLGNGLNETYSKYTMEDHVNTEEMSYVVDWYYKTQKPMKNAVGDTVLKTQVHYCRFCGDELLFASENLPEYQNGWYEHGMYPFVFDVMFPLKGSPAGFGYVDIMKNPQEWIDRFDTAISQNAELKSAPRYMAQVGVGLNEKDLMDPKKKIVTFTGNINSIQPIETPELPSICLETRAQKIEELKETSGNRDFSQGSTASGVTAASAIAALQEAGSKLSRDMIKGSYNAYAQIVMLTIELMRQFYDISRVFRVTRDNQEYDFINFSNATMKTEEAKRNFGQMIGGRKPFFDVKVSAQKASPFSRIAQNELAKELYGAGTFNPQYADQALMMLNMMDFDGKDQVIQKVAQNAQLYNENMQLKQMVVQLSQTLAQSGDSNSAMMAAAIAQRYGQQKGMPTVQKGSISGKGVKTNSLGGEISQDTKVERAKAEAAGRSSVK